MAQRFLDSTGVAKLWDLIVAKFTPKKISSTKGDAEIFNEVDGGGAKWTGANGIVSYVGVNDATGTTNGRYVSLYTKGGTHDVRLGLTENGAYYTTDEATFSAENELVTKGDLDEVIAIALTNAEIDALCQ